MEGGAFLGRRLGARGPDGEGFDERAYVRSMIEEIVRECPRRQAASEDERRAHDLVHAEFERMGLPGTFQEFRFNDSLYQNLALHFGLGAAGTAVSSVAPLLSMMIHLAVGTSHYLDSTRRGFLLRRLLPFKPSRNLVVRVPASRGAELRIVLLAHIDSAFTGLMFDPRLLRNLGPRLIPRDLNPLNRSLMLACYSQFLLAGVDAGKLVLGPLALLLLPLEALLAVPQWITFLLNLQVVLKNEIVPGANDDLSGVAALALLARRLVPSKPDNVELVFAVTGAEEASMGGAQALAREHMDTWDRKRTVIIGLDGLASGQLRWFEEGEVKVVPVPAWIEEILQGIAASDPRFGGLRRFRIPMGATDVLPFRSMGWDGVCLGCVDEDWGAPRHYHQPTDTPENLDPGEVVAAVDVAEKLVQAIVGQRTGKGPGTCS